MAGVFNTWGSDGLISRSAGSGTFFYTYDPSGSVATITDGSGTVLGVEFVDAFGHRVSPYSSRPVDFGGQFGYYDDAETGLVLCGHRYYDSFAARFVNRDPDWIRRRRERLPVRREQPCQW